MGGANAHAGRVELRKGLEVRWPAQNQYSVSYLGPETGFWLAKKKQVNTANHVTVVRVSNTIPVNEAMVRLDWIRFLKSEERLGSNSEDHGCLTAGKNRFVCSRLAVTNAHRFIAERHIWTEGRDVVMIRATVGDSVQRAESELDTFTLRLSSGK